ncbi:hypothetical protein FHW12_000705 [Dokdonella fugitiva]|uniref:Uncharacterized protein n=1 Tax=Dokdonella fugitiva TaxID=328517 RepID=A0A839F2I9_9GAMM|nr:hypothetical protein [Dokdonella fugitiva]MBA8886514.1 hypothetical protein [Dokdonella fugitiva]
MPRAVERLLGLTLAWILVHASVACARPSVTFVLGSDREGAGFFAAAATYYRMQAGADDETITGLRSLAEVREYLAREAARGGAPWGTIRVVAHGSEWYGLRVSIYAGDGSPATLTAMNVAHSSEAFPPLDRAVADGATQLLIESCGIGRRPPLVRAIATLLFGDEPAPRVVASRNFVGFRAWTDTQDVVRSERYELPYVALVTRATTADSARVRSVLERRWLRETGRPATDTLVLRDLPVEVRYRAEAGMPIPSIAEATLRDIGLHDDDLHWTYEGAMRVGRARIATLAAAEVEPIAASP